MDVTNLSFLSVTMSGISQKDVNGFYEIWGMGSSWYRKYRVDSAVVPQNCTASSIFLLSWTELKPLKIPVPPAILEFRTAHQVGGGRNRKFATTIKLYVWSQGISYIPGTFEFCRNLAGTGPEWLGTLRWFFFWKGSFHRSALHHTPCLEEGITILLSKTWPNVDRFPKLFLRWT